MTTPMQAPDHEAELRAAADERLFESALAEVVTGDPARSLHERAAELPTAPSARTWWTAAMMLVAIAVAVSVALLRATEHRGEAGQDPRPLPDAVMIAGGRELRALPQDTANLIFQESVPADLSALTRLTGLRALSMNAQFERDGERSWRDAGPELLEPLTELVELEQLGLPFPMPLTAAHLAVLQRCPKLRRLRIAGAVMQLDEATVSTLAQWPALRHLEFMGVPVTAEGISRLATLPQLDAVEFWRCPGFDGDGFAAILRLERLRQLRLIGIGETNDALPGRAGTTAWGPTPDDLRGLQRLERLRKLALYAPSFSPAAIDALPTNIEQLSLSFAASVSPESLRRLRRLAQVSELEVALPAELSERELAEIDAAAADLVAALPLRSLTWSGPFGPVLARSLGSAPAIDRLALAWQPGADFAPLARMPRMTRLTLFERWTPTASRLAGPVATAAAVPTTEQGTAALRPLRDSRSLRSVVLYARTWPEQLIAALREALGPTITFVVR